MQSLKSDSEMRWGLSLWLSYCWEDEKFLHLDLPTSGGAGLFPVQGLVAFRLLSQLGRVGRGCGLTTGDSDSDIW